MDNISVYIYRYSSLALDLGLLKGDKRYGLVYACCTPAAKSRNTWSDLVIDLIPFDLRKIYFDTLYLVRVSVLDRYWINDAAGTALYIDTDTRRHVFPIGTQKTSLKNN